MISCILQSLSDTEIMAIAEQREISHLKSHNTLKQLKRNVMKNLMIF